MNNSAESSLAEHIPHPLGIVVDKVFVYANPLLVQLFDGVSIVGKGLGACFDPASSALFEQLIQTQGESAIREIEANILTPRGSCPVSVSMGPIVWMGQAGEIITFRDLTMAKKMEKNLRDSELRYRTLTLNMQDLVSILDRNLYFLWLSPSDRTLLGYERQELAGKSIMDIMAFTTRLQLEGSLNQAEIDAKIEQGQGRAIWELELRRKNGAPFWAELSISHLEDGSGLREFYLAVARDISERKAAQFKVGQSEARFKRILEYLPVPVIVMLYDWSIDRVNTKFQELFGWSAQEISHFDHWWEKAFPDPEYRESMRQKAMDMVGNVALNGRESSPLVMRIHCRDGEERIAEARFIYLEGNGIWTFTDITELHHKEARLHQYATTDELTGIYNRRTGMAVLERAMSACRLAHLPLSICYLDVNNLKTTNDSLGHAEGDKLLQVVVEAVNAQIRRSDTLCRTGGDEFLIVFPECDRDHAETIVQAVVDDLEAINARGEYPYTIGFSYGIEEMSDGQSMQELVAHADKSMYAAKRRFHAQERT